MAIRGIGVDVVKVDRLSQSLERFGARMENRLFTPGELEYCRRHKDPLPHLAARFAAKEAFFKATQPIRDKYGAKYAALQKRILDTK